jgi:L-threonylcarbamoyladenylate synthase
MPTRILHTDEIDDAAELLKQGELVAFPTETVYGLGGNGLDAASAAKIYAAKGRPSDNPLILHVASAEMIETIAGDLSELAQTLITEFWPGGLTLVLNKKPIVPAASTGGLSTVAVRMPAHPVALELIAACGFPLAAPSANKSGRPSPTRVEHVIEDLDGEIAAILDAGPTRIGMESTVLDLSGEHPAILRFGAVTEEELRNFIPNLQSPTDEQRKRAPGTRYRHYSPNAKVTIVPLGELPENHLEKEGRTAYIGYEPCDAAEKYHLENDARDYAKQLFALLRKADHDKVDHILVQAIDEAGLGAAVMDRLRRAAGQLN